MPSRTLWEKQVRFSWCVSMLIQEAMRQGYEVTFGEAWRPPEQAALMASKGKGIPNSVHTSRLAVDLNLFKDGKYLDDTESHTTLGAYWKTLDPDARWGGNFKRKDGNHYSFTHGGVS